MPQSRSELKRTLRDTFAAAALAGLCANPEFANSGTAEKIAEWAWEQADAMLKSRDDVHIPAPDPKRGNA